MTEKYFEYSTEDIEVIEKIVDTENVSVAHAVIKPKDGLPAHNANADVILILTSGQMSAVFDGKPEKNYCKGNAVCIPKGTHMQITNTGEGLLEFFAIKTPSPTFSKQ